MIHRYRAVCAAMGIFFGAVSCAFQEGATGARMIGPTHAGILWSVGVSADGLQLAIGGERALWIVDSGTQERVATLAASGTVNAVHWHPSGRLLAVCGDDALTAIHDLEAGNRIPLQTSEGSRDIAWNPAGDRIATAGNDGSTQIWSSRGALLHTVRPRGAKSLTGVAWRPNGQSLVTVGEFISLHRPDGSLVKRERQRPSARGFCLPLCVTWHPSGEFFVVGDYGNREEGEPPVLQFWSKDLTPLVSVPIEGGREIRKLAFSRDGVRLFSASDGLRIWSVRYGSAESGPSGRALPTALRLLGTHDPESVLWGICVDPAGTSLFATTEDGRTLLWTGPL